MIELRQQHTGGGGERDDWFKSLREWERSCSKVQAFRFQYFFVLEGRRGMGEWDMAR